MIGNERPRPARLRGLLGFASPRSWRLFARRDTPHMVALRTLGRFWAIGLTASALGAVAAQGDTVVLKNGVVYRGTVDREKPLLWVYDGLRRVVVRDSKVAKIDSDAALRNLEAFRLEQPLTVHGGVMPKEVVSVKAGPWNDRGRRSFEFVGSRLNKTTRMEQAINELGPRLVKLRGVDGYWVSQLDTSQVPREVVLGTLAKVDQQDKNERVRVARFLIQAGWYAEARAELDRILKTFRDDPDLRERVALARASVGALEAAQIKTDIDRLKLARQPREAAALLHGFPTKDVALDLETLVHERQRFEDAQFAADKSVADALSALHGFDRCLSRRSTVFLHPRKFESVCGDRR